MLLTEALAAVPKGDDDPKLENAPKPLAGLIAPAAAAANGDDVVWLANAPNPVAGFTNPDDESPEPVLEDGVCDGAGVVAKDPNILFVPPELELGPPSPPNDKPPIPLPVSVSAASNISASLS
jgi:hypothetical protein